MKKIALVRRKRNLKQREISDLLGISLVSYCNKEKGRAGFKENEINKLIEFFELSYEELFEVE